VPDLQLDPADVRDEIQSADKQVKVAADHLKMRGGEGIPALGLRSAFDQAWHGSSTRRV